MLDLTVCKNILRELKATGGKVVKLKRTSSSKSLNKIIRTWMIISENDSRLPRRQVYNYALTGLAKPEFFARWLE